MYLSTLSKMFGVLIFELVYAIIVSTMLVRVFEQRINIWFAQRLSWDPRHKLSAYLAPDVYGLGMLELPDVYGR